MSSLRVLSYNIHKGFDWSNRAYILEKLREAIRSTQAQIVFLQEVAGDSKHHTDVQFEYLADTIWSHYAYGKNALTSQGHHGNAILSLYPLIQWSNHNISTNPFEQRGLLHGVVQLGETRLHLLNTHFGLFERERVKQARWVNGYISKTIPAVEPILLGGDLNDWRERLAPVFEEVGLKECHQELLGHLVPTFPARKPWLCLDRLYTRGLSPLTVQTYRGEPWQGLSDHLPICVDLQQTPPLLLT